MVSLELLRFRMLIESGRRVKSRFFRRWGIQILVLGLVLMGGNVKAQGVAPSETLYQVVLPVPAQENEAGHQKQLKLQVYQGMKSLLLRLVGSKTALDDQIFAPFLNHPMRWLKVYTYRPHYEEGVMTGEELVLQFDRQRLLTAFQKNGVRIWPLAKRPAVLMIGHYWVSDVEAILDASGLAKHLNLDYRPVAESLRLPIIPFDMKERPEGKRWTYWVQTASAQAQLEQWAKMYQASVIGVFDLENSSKGYILHYAFWSPEPIGGGINEHILQGNIQGEEIKSLYEKMLVVLMERLSKAYRQDTATLKEIVFTVERPASAQKIFHLEKILNDLKPNLHQVMLRSITPKRLVFDMTYQGELGELIRRLQQSTGLEIETSLGEERRLQGYWHENVNSFDALKKLKGQLKQEIIDQLHSEAS